MKAVLVDSCVILDIFQDNHQWVDWSESILNQYSHTHAMVINPIIYTEISIGFRQIEELEEAVTKCGFQIEQKIRFNNQRSLTI